MKTNEIFYTNGFTSAWLNSKGTFTVETCNKQGTNRIEYNTIKEVYKNH